MLETDSKIKPSAADLKREESPHGDHYIGRSEYLIAAGLITADQLPGRPGRGKTMCTFYDGVPVKQGVSNTKRDERYLQIKRIGKKFEVLKGVPKGVAEERRLAHVAEMPTRTPENFRDTCLATTELLTYYLDGRDDRFPFAFPADMRNEIGELLSEVAELIRSSEVMPLHPEKASVARPNASHLQLVWSAP